MDDIGLTLPHPPPADDENIVSFVTGKPVTEFPLTSVRHRPSYCPGQCRRVYVVESTRLLECQDCKRAIDPFDYVNAWARRGDARLSSLRDLDAQITKRSVELRQIRTDIDNAKSRLRRAVVNLIPDPALTTPIGDVVNQEKFLA